MLITESRHTLAALIVFIAVVGITFWQTDIYIAPYIAPLLYHMPEREIVRGDVSKKQVIFTFDGGDTAVSADGILKTLAAHGVKGTFFLTGKFVERNPDLVRNMVAAGHEIFNHTYDHPHLTTVTDGLLMTELTKMSDTLTRVAGVSAQPYFRAPYGDRNAHMLSVAYAAGYRSVYWTDDALDWEEPTGMSADEVRKRILSHVQPGEIYLMHVGDTITGQILDGVLTEIEARGYKAVSLTQGL